MSDERLRALAKRGDEAAARVLMVRALRRNDAGLLVEALEGLSALPDRALPIGALSGWIDARLDAEAVPGFAAWLLARGAAVPFALGDGPMRSDHAPEGLVMGLIRGDAWLGWGRRRRLPLSPALRYRWNLLAAQRVMAFVEEEAAMLAIPLLEALSVEQWDEAHALAAKLEQDVIAPGVYGDPLQYHAARAIRNAAAIRHQPHRHSLSLARLVFVSSGATCTEDEAHHQLRLLWEVLSTSVEGPLEE